VRDNKAVGGSVAIPTVKDNKAVKLPMPPPPPGK
jgi:hypothetical protein